VTSFRQLVDSKTASPNIQKTMETEIAIENGMGTLAYKDRTLNRDKLRLAVSAKMAELQLDAILYPLQKILVSAANQPDQPERNGTLSNATGFPAVTFPGGFLTPTATVHWAFRSAPNCWALTTVSQNFSRWLARWSRR
jgi:amidase